MPKDALNNTQNVQDIYNLFDPGHKWDFYTVSFISPWQEQFPKSFRGVPIVLLAAAIMSLSFMGFGDMFS